MIRKFNRPVFWLILIFALMTFSGIKTEAATDEGFTVVLPVAQTLTNKALNYQLTATSPEAPMPQKLSQGEFSLINVAKTELAFSFVRPGRYSYRLAVVGSGSEAVRAKDKFFTINILVYYSSSYEKSSIVVMKDATGYKVEGLTFQPIAAVPMTSIKPTKPLVTSTRNPARTPVTGKLPQTGELVKSFSWLGLLLILIAFLKMVITRYERKRR